MSESSTRSRALRALLVDRVGMSAPRVWPRRRVGALVLTVALASGATGALSAAAIARSSPYEPNVIASLALSVARPNSVLVGQPVYASFNGVTTLNLGVAPAGATGVAIKVGCTEPGSSGISLDGKWIMGVGCDSASPTGGGGAVSGVTGSGNHTLTLTSEGRTTFEAWVAWVTEPPLPGPSPQQISELADGLVTRDEYLAAYNRFAGCLAAKGFDVSPSDPNAVILSYVLPSAAVDSGADEFCYGSQFKDVDMAWQVAHEGGS